MNGITSNDFTRVMMPWMDYTSLDNPLCRSEDLCLLKTNAPTLPQNILYRSHMGQLVAATRIDYDSPKLHLNLLSTTYLT